MVFLWLVMSIISLPFGRTPAGEAVVLYMLTNGKGMEVAISTYGAWLCPESAGPERNAGRRGSGFRQP